MGSIRRQGWTAQQLGNELLGHQHADLRAVLEDMVAINANRILNIQPGGWHLDEEYTAWLNGDFNWDIDL